MKKQPNKRHVPISHEDLKGTHVDKALNDLFIEIQTKRTTDDLFHMATHSNDVEEALLEIKRRGLDRDFEIWKYIQKRNFKKQKPNNNIDARNTGTKNSTPMQLKVIAIKNGRKYIVKLSEAQTKVIEQVCKMNPKQKIELEMPDHNYAMAMDRFAQNDHLPGARNDEGYKAFITRKNPTL